LGWVVAQVDLLLEVQLKLALGASGHAARGSPLDGASVAGYGLVGAVRTVATLLVLVPLWCWWFWRSKR